MEPHDLNEYYRHIGAAYVRGMAVQNKEPAIADLCRIPFQALTEQEIDTLFLAGSRMGLKMYRFKRTHEELPRVRRVLGFLKSLPFESLLDAGSGRGVFLFPFMEQFPRASVTAVDVLEHRTAFLETIHRGGMEQLTVMQADICSQPLPDHSVDIVTLLEILEHIPDVERAVAAAVRMARKYVVVSVPSKEDNNPEHIHLLTKKTLTDLFTNAGCTRLHFDGVNGHLILTATIHAQES